MLNYFIVASVPIAILIIVFIGIFEKKDVFKLFIEGCLDGLKVVYNIFPYIFAITIAIGLLRNTGALELILKPISPLLSSLGIPSNVVPLFLLRPLSGGASMSAVIDIFKESGPDSISGKIASIIMGATETTLYCITILFGAAKIKRLRGTLIAGLIADFVAIVTTILIINLKLL